MDSRQIPGGPSVPPTSQVTQPSSVPPPSGPPPSVPPPPPPIPPRTTATTTTNATHSEPPTAPPRPPPPSPGLADKSAPLKSEVILNLEEKSKEPLLTKEDPAESSKKPTPPQTLNPKQTKPTSLSTEATKIVNEQIQKHYLFRDLIGNCKLRISDKQLYFREQSESIMATNGLLGECLL